MENTMGELWRSVVRFAPPWLEIAIAAIAVVGLIGVLWFRLQHPHRKLQRKVRKLGAQVLSNVRLPDGVDGEIHIDYLVLTEKGILVLDVKQYDGLIYGSENHDEWMQVIKRRNYAFANPLQQMDMRIMAVKSVVPDANVEGAVLFAGRSYFPKRTPTGIITLEDIPKQRHKSEVSQQMQVAWQQLTRIHNSQANKL